jgi:hypothetical protein
MKSPKSLIEDTILIKSNSFCYIRRLPSDASAMIPHGHVPVPLEPIEYMIVNGFESEPEESFSDAEVWEEYESICGCQQAAHRAKLCWAAMVKAAPKYDANKQLS